MQRDRSVERSPLRSRNSKSTTGGEGKDGSGDGGRLYPRICGSIDGARMWLTKCRLRSFKVQIACRPQLPPRSATHTTKFDDVPKWRTQEGELETASDLRDGPSTPFYLGVEHVDRRQMGLTAT